MEHRKKIEKESKKVKTNEECPHQLLSFTEKFLKTLFFLLKETCCRFFLAVIKE